LLKKIKRVLKKSFFKEIFKLFNLIAEPIKLAQHKNLNNDTSSRACSFFFNSFKSLLYQELILIRRLKLKLNLNKYKFEEKFLYKLSKLISRFYNKKVEFNIINLKHYSLNIDMLMQILTRRIAQAKNANSIIRMKEISNKAYKSHTPIRTINKNLGFSPKHVNLNLTVNRFKNLNLHSIIRGIPENLDNILKDIYYNIVFNSRATILDFASGSTKIISARLASKVTKNYTTDGAGRATKNYTDIYNTILNSIKYKTIRGIRLKVKGRLTRRYRADKSISSLL
jgi:hypothetical protein